MLWFKCTYWTYQRELFIHICSLSAGEEVLKDIGKIVCYQNHNKLEQSASHVFIFLTHWGRVTHICVNKLTIISSDNGLSPGRRQAIIWTNAGILLIGPLGTNVSEILVGIQTFLLKKMHLKVSSGKCLPFCLGLNVLIGFLLYVIMTLVNDLIL